MSRHNLIKQKPSSKQEGFLISRFCIDQVVAYQERHFAHVEQGISVQECDAIEVP